MKNNGNFLKFNKDGKFKILQLTDIHGIYKKAPDTIRLIEKALDSEKPDLIVFTGDQIKGYGLSFLTGDKNVKVRQAIDNFLKPVSDRNIPFVATYGNHDPQVGLSFDEQLAIYKEYNGCITADSEYTYDASTFSVPVMTSDGSDTALQLYLIYSGTSSSDGYEPVAPERVEWYRTVRDKLFEKHGRYIPSFVFQHIPVRETYELFDEVSKKHPDAIKAFRTHKGKYYKLKDQYSDGKIKLYEPPAVSDINTGEFDALTEKGDVVALFFGHDHQNNFYGNVRGVDLGYSPACGFGEYGNGVERGVRVFEFDEKDVRNYKTRIVTYRDYFGKKVIKPLNNLFLKIIPASKDAAIPFAMKCVGILLAVIAVIVAICKLF
ncbi:MAG: metallophosphoesterase family protein [Clostridia bacterium]|nr:metallophosphoesterase family protein [Clostridia bacterium]